MDKKIKMSKSVLLGFFLLINPLIFAGSPPEGDGSGAFATGNYRNMFRENGHSNKEIALKINTAFNQLFHGDTAHTVYFGAGKNDRDPWPI